MDIGISIAGLTLFALLLPIVFIIQKVDSPGPLFFSQTRIGINRRRFAGSKKSGLSEDRRHIVYPGKPFKIIKLRTMRVDAEAEGPQWAKLNDTRITRFGNFLRKSRLDEFPQFLNVLRGEMSVIGPRPERLCFIRQLENEVPHYHERLHVLPGITGLAQVVNGYDTDLESVRRKVELDRRYIAKAGFRFDMSILLMTARVLMNKHGAH
jgi:lipopolysaccharide/colanic/teichoic acid biosynthesis glycosyltransferase